MDEYFNRLERGAREKPKSPCARQLLDRDFYRRFVLSVPPVRGDNELNDTPAMRALRTRTNFRITGRPLIELPALLKQITGIPVRFDRSVLWSHVRFDQPITVEVPGIPLSQALQQGWAPLISHTAWRTAPF